MSLSKKGIQTIDLKLATSSKPTSLNPNATEFIPFSLRSPSAVSAVDTDAPSKFAAASASDGKAVINRTESTLSNNLDDEARQFWQHQLPDDITPDFKVMDENVSPGLGPLSLGGLSLHNDGDAARFSASAVSGFSLSERQELLPDQLTGSSFTKKLGFGGSSVSDDTPPGRLLSTNPWDKRIANSDLIFGSSREAASFKGGSKLAFIGDGFTDHGAIDDMDTSSHLEFLSLNFPGFDRDSLAEVYYANGCHLNMTIEILTQLELQVDGSFHPNLNLKTLFAPNHNPMDFPALSSLEGQAVSRKYVGDDLHPTGFPFRPPEKENLLQFKSSSSTPFRGTIDFASAVKKVPVLESSIWKYERNGSANATMGTSQSSQMPAGAYSGGIGRGSYGDRVSNQAASAQAAPAWLETGGTVDNLYPELREEARVHARLRNAYLEQARQAYLVGNKALAKELSVKGQLHGMHMKAAHGKAQESIYHQRNLVPLELQGDGRGKERVIDLLGLHISEAIHVLKSELHALRVAARAANQRLLVYICVGTGHHTRGSRTPTRVLGPVQRYLLEEEGLDYSEPQPGLLRVVIY
ncbi:hypothetical protein MLD38_006507 [Melastoma candidum]|uniref:Uncharacterized protein n=1 Tax=Melastoma candidum TaxID=119954 RepID=A0ACB9RR49_9MYRT|nr:hypothetical protein MLD38_006507 [Melastoma candidum]